VIKPYFEIDQDEPGEPFYFNLVAGANHVWMRSDMGYVRRGDAVRACQRLIGHLGLPADTEIYDEYRKGGANG
jgi:uncharacterized protein YegP (UPF0339 family)